MVGSKNKGRKRVHKDVDEIHDDMKPNKAAKLLNQELDFDLPGDGQFYCLQCARYFTDDKTLREHKKTRIHKQQLRRLLEEPYTQKEANAAAGCGAYKHVKNLTTKEKMEKAKEQKIQAESEMEASEVKEEVASVC